MKFHFCDFFSLRLMKTKLDTAPSCRCVSPLTLTQCPLVDRRVCRQNHRVDWSWKSLLGLSSDEERFGCWNWTLCHVFEPSLQHSGFQQNQQHREEARSASVVRHRSALISSGFICVFISSTQMSEYPSSPCIHLKICSFHAGALRGGVTVTTVNLGTMDFFTQFTFQVSAGGFCLLWQTQITETVERDTLKLENMFEYIGCYVTVWTSGWFGFILQRFCTSWQTWRCGVYQRSYFERRQDKVRLLFKAFQRRVCKWLVWKLMGVEYTSCDGVRKANLRW